MQNGTTETTDNGGKHPERIFAGPGIEAGGRVFAFAWRGGDMYPPFLRRPLDPRDLVEDTVDFRRGGCFGLKISVNAGIPLMRNKTFFTGQDGFKNIRR